VNLIEPLRHLSVRKSVRDLLNHRGLPGYEFLPLATRIRLDLQSLIGFLNSIEALFFAACLTIWLLAAYTLVWSFDLRGPAAAVPPLTGALWAWPWLANARRRIIGELLRRRWPD